MESIKVKAFVGQDGLFSLRLPIRNQDVEAMVIYQPVSKSSHRESKRRFRELLDSYNNGVAFDSTELLREDRGRG